MAALIYAFLQWKTIISAVFCVKLSVLCGDENQKLIAIKLKTLQNIVNYSQIMLINI